MPHIIQTELNHDGLLLSPTLHDYEILDLSFRSKDVELTLGFSFSSEVHYLIKFHECEAINFFSNHMQNVIFRVYALRNDHRLPVPLKKIVKRKLGTRAMKSSRMIVVIEPASGVECYIGCHELSLTDLRRGVGHASSMTTR